MGPVSSQPPPPRGGRAINWATFPEGLPAGFKRAGWPLLNLPTPAELLERAARVPSPSDSMTRR